MPSSPVRKCPYETYLGFKYGAVLSACFQIFSSTLMLILTAVITSCRESIIQFMVVNFKPNRLIGEVASNRTEILFRESFSPTISLVLYGAAVINIIFSAMLLIGIAKRSLTLFHPWFVLHGVFIGVLAHMLLIVFAYTVMTNFLLCLLVTANMILIFVLEMKIFYAVWAFYELMSDFLLNQDDHVLRHHISMYDNLEDCGIEKARARYAYKAF